jgi:hypothetical protein
MDIERRKSKLMQMGVTPFEMYVFPTGQGDRKLLIVRRTGIEKLEKLFGIRYKYISVTESPYKDKCNVTVIMQGESDEHPAIQALGSANPDTTNLPFISDVANKRARHKIVLKIADLYQYDVHSEDESEDFRPTKKLDPDDAFKEAFKKISL